MDAEQALSVILSRPPLHPALVIQKRRALGEEHRKSTQGRIFQGIALVVASPSLVRLIERFWKLAKRCCLHARSYPTFQDFKTSILRFIETAQTEWAANAPLAAASSCPQRSSRRRAAGTIQHCGGAPVAGPTASHNARATASRLKTVMGHHSGSPRSLAHSARARSGETAFNSASRPSGRDLGRFSGGGREKGAGYAAPTPPGPF